MKGRTITRDIRRDIRFRTVEDCHSSRASLIAEYLPKHGPGLQARTGFSTRGKYYKVDKHFLMQDLADSIQREWVERRALIDPIDNGPADRVALSEALTRVKLCGQTWFLDNREGRPVDSMTHAIDCLEAITRVPYEDSPNRSHHLKEQHHHATRNQ